MITPSFCRAVYRDRYAKASSVSSIAMWDMIERAESKTTDMDHQLLIVTGMMRAIAQLRENADFLVSRLVLPAFVTASSCLKH